MSGIYDLTLANNAAGNIGVLGDYCKVISAPSGAVQIKLDGGESFTLLEGQGVRMPDGKSFRDLQVKNVSGSAQTLLLFAGDGRIEDTRITGNVVIVDALSAGVTTAGMASVTAIGGPTNTLLLDPTANLRGAIIRAAALEATAGAGGNVNSRILAAPTAAPAGPTGNLLTLGILLTSSTTQQSVGQFDLKKRIPPGWGVWHQTVIQTAVATTNTGSLSFELQ